MCPPNDRLDLSEVSVRSVLNKFSSLPLDQAQHEIRGQLDDKLNNYSNVLSGPLNAVQGVSGLNRNAVDLAATIAVACCVAIHDQKEKAENQEESLFIEIKTHIATFIVPDLKNNQQLSVEQHVMSDFFKCMEEYPAIKPYLGINVETLKAQKKLLGSLPKRFFYSTFVQHQVMKNARPMQINPQSLDKAEEAIYAFNHSIVPLYLSEVEKNLEMSSAYSFFLSVYQGNNFLNHIRAPRFIMIALANLLGNLKQPVDPKTDTLCSVEKSIQLCKTALQFINKLLDIESTLQLRLIHNDTNHLFKYIKFVDLHIRDLQKAFTDKNENELNIQDLITQAHTTVRIINTTVLKLVYVKKHPGNDAIIYDEKMGYTLQHSLYMLNNLLSHNIILFDIIQPYESLVLKLPYINKPSRTLIDILVVFCHLSSPERKELIKSIRQRKLESLDSFADQLSTFNETFIKPIKDISKHEMGVTSIGFSSFYREVASLTSKRLLPILTLFIEEYKLDISIENVFNSRPGEELSRVYSGGEQVKLINKASLEKSCTDFYDFKLSPYLGLHETGIQMRAALVIDQLPIYQYQIIRANNLLEKLGDLIEHYRNFLNYKYFQKIMLEKFNTINIIYVKLKEFISGAQQILSSHNAEYIRRGLRNELEIMATNLDQSIGSFTTLMANLRKKVCAPDFTDKQKEILDKKLKEIDEEYVDLFGLMDGNSLFQPESYDVVSKFSEISNSSVTGGTGVTALFPLSVNTNNTNNTSSKIRDSIHTYFTPQNDFKNKSYKNINLQDFRKQREMFLKVINQCINALSISSYYGHKGRLLKILAERISEKNDSFVPNDSYWKRSIIELVKLTACYRDTFFFQAAYGQTRAALALMAAIRDPEVNDVLPLLDTILPNYEGDPADLTDNEILLSLLHVKSEYGWSGSIHDVGGVMLS